MYVCVYVCMFVCMYVMYVCMYAFMYVCMYAYVCMYVCMCVSIEARSARGGYRGRKCERCHHFEARERPRQARRTDEEGRTGQGH